MAAPPPDLVLAYLRELSTDIRAAVVLDRRGERLAGEAAVTEPARALLAAAERPFTWVKTTGGAAVAARGERLAIVLALGPHALVALVRHDVMTALADLEDRPATAGPDTAGPGSASPLSAPVRAAAHALVAAASASA